MNFIDFRDQKNLTTLLQKLDKDKKPIFGIMTPQHMIEHLSIVVSISNGKRYVSPVAPEDKWSKGRDFIDSPMPIKEGIVNPYLGNKLPSLYFKNMDEALQRMYMEIKNFEIHYSSNPEDTPAHPYFGPLNKNHWIKFHDKHFTHHFRQFDLLPH